MAKVYFLNEDCFETMKRMEGKDYKVDLILTSPPYNTARTSKTQKSLDTYNNRYDIHLDIIKITYVSKYLINIILVDIVIKEYID